MEHNLTFDLDALLVFGKVVESRSLSKAAALLGMPKSTVSRKLTKLESDLGIKLLRKNTHQITVTDLGEKIYHHAVNILTEANGVRALVEGSRQEPQGELRVAIPVFVGIDYASRVGATFLQRYPQSRLDIRLVDNMVDPIRDGFDVVFGPGPLQDSTLIARKVFDLSLFLCASADFVRQLPEPVTAPSQLDALPFIDFGFAGPRRLTIARHKKRYELSPQVRARANNFQVCKEYILQGLGIGAMPTQIICTQELREGTMVPVLPQWAVEPLAVHMIYPFELSFSTLISAFYDTACQIIVENIARSRDLAGATDEGQESPGP
ncbi:LysR family transcriptional regulator [Mycobacterium asiaticum]|uniref:LysR family transcriptional regulator n=1 Tax=Mycobacterium asiaticum TaxID=1790 RepID=A0A1A3NS09_MYCAS|nr:LysR family transcriptional regulator [Mycobacterium asiaticum]OBK24858.1 LysR family transcriptional regulator [Mycobacterium asiaticum]